jgi:phage baseplate assembly protein W
MLDIFLTWNGDLAVSSTGDIAVAAGTDVTNQRVYRRLLTNPGDYLWNLGYGGGLAEFVGRPARASDIESVIRNQIEQESSVAEAPVPNVTVRTTDTANGYVVADITYSDAASGVTSQLSVSAGG